MSDTPDPGLEQRLGLVLRGVQRMADGLGTIEARLPELAAGDDLKALSDRIDEYRVRARTEVGQVNEVVTALANAVDAVMREQQALSEIVRREPPPADDAAVDRLTEAVRALRDDLAESHRILQEETRAAVDRVAGEQAERVLRLHEAIGEAGQRTADAVVRAVAEGADSGITAADLQQLRTTLDGRHVVVTEAIAAVREQVAAAVNELGAVIAAPPTEGPPGPARDDTLVRASLAELRADLRRLQGDVISSMGQLRTDAGANQAQLRDEVVQAVVARVQQVQAGGGADVDAVLDRISMLEARLPQPTSLEPVLARLEALEAKLAEPLDISALDARLAALEARIVPADLTAVEAKLAALEERLDRPDLAGVEGRLAAFVERLASPDLSGIEAKLAGLEGRVAPIDLSAVEAKLAELEAGLAPADLTGIFDRLGGIEWRMGERLDPLDGRLAALEQRLDTLRTNVPDGRLVERLAALEAGLDQLAQREDLRRGVDRVLGAVSSSEQAVAGEVRAVDARIGAIAEEVRVVRVLRDGLDALADGIDGVRQLTARAATSQQMTEVTAELAAVLREIESARSQVLEVEQSANPVRAEVVAVGTEVDDLGKRIDHLAELVEQKVTTGGGAGTAEVSQRLRQMSVTARQLGNGVLEDLRSRRKR